jgi:hypothetical protein
MWLIYLRIGHGYNEIEVFMAFYSAGSVLGNRHCIKRFAVWGCYSAGSLFEN